MADRASLPSSVSEKPASSSYAAEAELISRILAGERERYYDLIAPYQRVVYASALSLLHNETEAEDCAQEAFIKAYCHLRDFKGESKFGSWVVRIALNEAKMKLRKLRPALYESLDERPGSSNDQEEREYVPQVRPLATSSACPATGVASDRVLCGSPKIWRRTWRAVTS